MIGVTFDNLGEVTALARGQWPEGEPLGEHFSVTRALPRILELLDEVSVRATFFVEGLNAELYPDTLRELDAAGHEVALHGWRHEPWAELEPDEERELLDRGVRALSELSLPSAGFRPPGGRLTSSSRELLLDRGFRYVSPASPAAELDGLAVLPFRWELVDAFHYLPQFAPLRQRLIGSSDPQPPARLRTEIENTQDGIAIFHPFLLDDDERFAVLRAVAGGARPLRELA